MDRLLSRLLLVDKLTVLGSWPTLQGTWLKTRNLRRIAHGSSTWDRGPMGLAAKEPEESITMKQYGMMDSTVLSPRWG